MRDEVRVVRRALERADAQGRFQTSDLRGLREGVESLGASPLALEHPADLFGPWCDLTPRARGTLRDLAARDLRRSAALYPRGGVWTGLVRACRHADAYMTDRAPTGRLRQLSVRATSRTQDGPLNLWRKATAARGRHRWAKGTRPGPGDLLATLGRDPRWLLGDFATGVPLPPAAPGFWDDGRRNVVHGYHIGLDMLPTPSGVYCIEANLRTGLRLNRYAVEAGTAIPEAVMNVARAHGVRRLVWLEMQLPVIDRVLEALVDSARAADLVLEVLEDPTMLPPASRSWLASRVATYRDLDREPRNTLVISRRQRSWGADFVFTHKDPSTRILEAHLRETGETAFKVLPMTREPRIPQGDTSDLPNLVYKYPDSGGGRGVYFIRARDAAHATEIARRLDHEKGEPPGLFQSFVPGVLASGGRVFDVRTEIFVTPRRVDFGVAIRRVSGQPRPDRVDHGIVQDGTPFISNIKAGGRLEAPGEELSMVRTAALAVGEAIRRGLSATFRHGPDG